MVEPRKSRRHEQTPAAPPTPQGPGASKSKQTEQFVLTLDNSTHDVLEAVRVDTAGQRHQLSDEECLALVDEMVVDDVMRGMDEAFEAGLIEGFVAASVLFRRRVRSRLSDNPTATEQRRKPIGDHPRNGSNGNH